MSDGMGREPAYLSSHATNRYFIPNWGINCEVAGGCAWCQGENYDAADTNTFFQRATAICKMHKARVRANNYYWNKLYRKLELGGQSKEELPSSTHINLNC